MTRHCQNLCAQFVLTAGLAADVQGNTKPLGDSRQKCWSKWTAAIRLQQTGGSCLLAQQTDLRSVHIFLPSTSQRRIEHITCIIHGPFQGLPQPFPLRSEGHNNTWPPPCPVRNCFPIPTFNYHLIMQLCWTGAGRGCKEAHAQAAVHPTALRRGAPLHDRAPAGAGQQRAVRAQRYRHAQDCGQDCRLLRHAASAMAQTVHAVHRQASAMT